MTQATVYAVVAAAASSDTPNSSIYNYVGLGASVPVIIYFFRMLMRQSDKWERFVEVLDKRIEAQQKEYEASIASLRADMQAFREDNRVLVEANKYLLSEVSRLEHEVANVRQRTRGSKDPGA